MTHIPQAIKSKNTSGYGLLVSYSVGFGLSLLLTIFSYLAVVEHIVPSSFVITAIIGLALLQLMVQMVFFLHIHKEEKTHWNLFFFLSTVSIFLLVVIGSIWIMNHLNYNMAPQDVDQYMMEEEAIRK